MKFITTSLINTISIIFLFNGIIYAGSFSGELILFPENCQQTDSRKCKLGSELTYRSSTGKQLVWQTDKWQDDNNESGTTDGASIPKWAWPIIGDPYDPSYLKAAIIHDHYCYKENHVRTWRETHLMFYEALIDLDIDPIKAKTMYFAVYLFGPHWVKLVPGEDCGDGCIKSFYHDTKFVIEEDRFLLGKSQEQIYEFQKVINDSPEMSIEEIERYARNLEPDNFFLENGNVYSPKGLTDIKIIKLLKYFE